VDYLYAKVREKRECLLGMQTYVSHTHTHTHGACLCLCTNIACVFMFLERVYQETERYSRSRQRACAYRWQASGAMAAWLEEMSKAVMTRDSSDTNAYSMVYLGSDERQVCTASARTLPSSMCHTLTHTSHVSVYARTSHVCLCT